MASKVRNNFVTLDMGIDQKTHIIHKRIISFLKPYNPHYYYFSSKEREREREREKRDHLPLLQKIKLILPMPHTNTANFLGLKVYNILSFYSIRCIDVQMCVFQRERKKEKRSKKKKKKKQQQQSYPLMILFTCGRTHVKKIMMTNFFTFFFRSLLSACLLDVACCVCVHRYTKRHLYIKSSKLKTSRFFCYHTTKITIGIGNRLKRGLSVCCKRERDFKKRNKRARFECIRSKERE